VCARSLASFCSAFGARTEGRGNAAGCYPGWLPWLAGTQAAERPAFLAPTLAGWLAAGNRLTVELGAWPITGDGGGLEGCTRAQEVSAAHPPACCLPAAHC